MPTPMGRPCPKAPVEASTPGTLIDSGCPPKIDFGSHVFDSSFFEKKPMSASTAYNAKQP